MQHKELTPKRLNFGGQNKVDIVLAYKEKGRSRSSLFFIVYYEN